MISSDVLLGSQDILDDNSWGPQKRFFGFSLGGYLEGGVSLLQGGCGESVEIWSLWAQNRATLVLKFDPKSMRL